MPVFSLPGQGGIGGFTDEAYRFIDFLAESGQKYWQILPLGPTGYGDSPYQSYSIYAGNPYFISLEELNRNGLITDDELAAADDGVNPEFVDYGRLYNERLALLRKAYERSRSCQDAGFSAFREEQSAWLHDYAVFMAVKKHFNNVSSMDWPEDVRRRDEASMSTLCAELEDEILFNEYVQYLFFGQWDRLHKYAESRGIGIIGDIPIYVSEDSADVWMHPELFKMGENGRPAVVAGCPPDRFAAEGQYWGNPVYRWDYHKETGYRWWIDRLRYCSRLYDVTRIDHFRGFDSYFEIPAGESALKGYWAPGPGIELFRAVREELPDTRIIAEDLGYITDSVRELIVETGFPNMKVLEFAFDSRDSSGKDNYLPYNYGKNCVVYTGTHDNETLVGWMDNILPEELYEVQRYLDVFTDDHRMLAGKVIGLAHSSTANLCIIPIQDYLKLGNEARINHPSTVGTNWTWRVKASDLTENLSSEIREVTERYGR